MSTRSKPIKITCSVCAATEMARPTSPAAPMLTALEQLKPNDWSYQIGFFTMLTGDHHPRCPACTKAASDTAKESAL